VRPRCGCVQRHSARLRGKNGFGVPHVASPGCRPNLGCASPGIQSINDPTLYLYGYTCHRRGNARGDPSDRLGNRFPTEVPSRHQDARSAARACCLQVLKYPWKDGVSRGTTCRGRLIATGNPAFTPARCATRSHGGWAGARACRPPAPAHPGGTAAARPPAARPGAPGADRRGCRCEAMRFSRCPEVHPR